MVININILREEKGGNPEEVKQSEIKRGRDGKVVDEIVDVDKKWRTAMFNMEQAKKECNIINKEIGDRKKKDSKCDCSDLVEKATSFKQQIPILEKDMNSYAKIRDTLLHKIGSIVHSSVFVSNDEANNKVLRSWGIPKRFSHSLGDCGSSANFIKGNLHHHEIMAKLRGFDCKKGVEVAGHRGVFLIGVLVRLNMALIQYGLNFLIQKGYTPVQPPYFMKKEVMQETAELKDFEETLYRIPMGGAEAEKKDKDDKRDDLFLIATSEQPISALHRGEWIEEKELPIKYAGISSCFRKEAGAHGKDTWGIFRVHQFDKVEQFCITKPDGGLGEDSVSCKMQEEMIGICEEFYQSLNLPYRIVSIVSGALNDAASRKYDLEAWFPGYDDFRELVSCSNCTDYQSRSLDIRLRKNKLNTTNHEDANNSASSNLLFDKDKQYVHMLNGTLVATQRCMCCILENYQTETGVRIPSVLTPYMGGLEFVPYVN